MRTEKASNLRGSAKPRFCRAEDARGRTPPCINLKLAFFKFVIFVAQAVVGVYHAILGTSLPAMRMTLDLDLSQAGAMGSAFWLGYTVSILAGGVLADRYERHKVAILGSLLMGLGSAMLGYWPPTFGPTWF